MWWKRILIAAAVLTITLCIAFLILINIVNFNVLKPEIEQTVLEATGRKLRLDGDLKIAFGVPPTLSVSDVTFSNASWGTQPEMVRIGELEIQIALVPLISGTFDIRRITLVDPDVTIETNREGNYNFELDLPDQSTQTSSSPPLTLDEIEIRNGKITYIDGQTGTGWMLLLDRVDARLMDQTGRIEVTSEVVYNDVAFQLEAETRLPFGRPPGDASMPVELNLRSAGTDLSLTGKIEDIGKLSGIDIKLVAAGKSISDYSKVAGIEDLPDPGPFGLQAVVQGSGSALSVNDLNFVVGSQGRLAAKIQGSIGNLLQAADADLNFGLRVEDIKNIEEIFHVSIPWEGDFETSGRVQSDTTGKYSLDGLKIKLAENRIDGSLLVDRTGSKPQVNGELILHRVDIRPVFKPGAFKPLASAPKKQAAPATEAKDKPESFLQVEGILNLFDSRLTVHTGELQIPKVSFSQTKALAVLKEGQLQIKLEGPYLPDIEQLSGVTHLPDLGPFQLNCQLTASGNSISLNNVDLVAGDRKTALVQASGNISDLTRPEGIEINLSIQGDDVAHLEKYLLQPWPLQGPFEVTGIMANSGSSILKFYNIAAALKGFDFSGSVDVDWSGKSTLVTVGVTARKFNLKPFKLPDTGVPGVMKKTSDLGPLDAQVEISVKRGKSVLQKLDLRAGTSNLARLRIQGTVADLAALEGIRLNVNTSGKDIANLEKLTGQPLPIRGPFGASGIVAFQGLEKFRISDVKLALAGNEVNADATLDVSDRKLKLDARLDASEFDLRPIEDLRKQTRQDVKNYVSETIMAEQRLVPSIALPAGLSANSDVNIRVSAQKVLSTTIQLSDLNAIINLSNGRMSLNAESPAILLAGETEANSELTTIGASQLNLVGSISDEKWLLRSVRLNAGTPDTVELKIEGTAAKKNVLGGVNLDFSARGKDAAFLNRLLKKDYQISGPFEFTGHMEDPTTRQYQIDDLRLMIANTDLNGQLVIDLKGERPGLKARLDSRTLDFRPFLPKVKIEEIKEPPAQESVSKTPQKVDQKVFPLNRSSWKISN